MGKALLSGGGINTQAVRQAVGGIASNAANVKAAYSAVRGREILWSGNDKISS
jgi:hypothetical protein